MAMPLFIHRHFALFLQPKPSEKSQVQKYIAELGRAKKQLRGLYISSSLAIDLIVIFVYCPKVLIDFIRS